MHAHETLRAMKGASSRETALRHLLNPTGFPVKPGKDEQCSVRVAPWLSGKENFTHQANRTDECRATWKKSNIRHDIMSYSCPSVVVVFENPEQVGEYQIFVSEHIQV